MLSYCLVNKIKKKSLIQEDIALEFDMIDVAHMAVLDSYVETTKY